MEKIASNPVTSVAVMVFSALIFGPQNPLVQEMGLQPLFGVRGIPKIGNSMRTHTHTLRELGSYILAIS